MSPEMKCLLEEMRDNPGRISSGAGSGAARASLEEIDRLREALEQIIERSGNGELGTSKVIDMRRIAEQALKQ